MGASDKGGLVKNSHLATLSLIVLNVAYLLTHLKYELDLVSIKRIVRIATAWEV